MDGPTFLLL